MSVSERVSDATGRIQLRRRLNRRQRLLTLGAGVLGFALLVAATWVVLGSSALAVTSVQVRGQKILTADSIRGVAEVPSGQSLVLVDIGAVAQRVSGLPPVAKVAVSRTWPNTITINVTERKPLFVVEAGSGYLVVDAEGVPFETLLTAPSDLIPAQADPADQALLVDVGTVLGTVDPELRTKVRTVAAATRNSITLVLHSGVRVMWGTAAQSDLKNQVLKALMKEVKATQYDVSAPSNPTTR